MGGFGARTRILAREADFTAFRQCQKVSKCGNLGMLDKKFLSLGSKFRELLEDDSFYNNSLIVV
jgi:hypothetical protein